jgi:hypothetical protein
MRGANLVVSWMVLLWVSLAARAPAQLTSLETEDTRLLFVGSGQSYLVPHAARCLINSLEFHRQLFDYTPSEEVSALLSDLSDRGNAGATALPRNRVTIQIAPLNFAFETVVANERMSSLMNHELVHVVVMDKAAKGDRRFRRLFQGKVMPVRDNPESILYMYLTNPRVAAPRWYQEGIAVFLETWMAGGIGRAQGAYDEMVFRSMTRDGSRFYDPLGLVSEGIKIDFQVGVNSYLYGTRFMSYLAHEYSPASLLGWVARTDGSKRYFATQFQEVYGISLEEAWSNWVAWEKEFQEANLAAIRVYPITPTQDLSPRPLGSVSRAYFDPDANKLYAAFNYPGVVSHVGSISVDEGSLERIVDIKGPALYSVASLAYDPESKTIFYTTDNLEYRDLRAVDPATKQSRTLLKDVRVGELVFNQSDRSIWGVRHFNGITTLVRIPHPYTEWEQVHSWPYGQLIYDLDISRDGELLSTSVGQINGDQSLQIFEIDSLTLETALPIAEYDFGTAIPSNFVFSPDGRYLYGSSYYTGVSNIFRFEVATGLREALSNSETGLFRPLPLGDGQLFVFRYTGEGFVPARMEAKPLEDLNPIVFLGQKTVQKHPVLEEWLIGSPADIPLDAMTTDRGDYKLAHRLRLESVYPVLEGYKDYEAVGLRINFSDPMSLNQASLVASYTPDEQVPSDERLHLDLSYQRYDWRFSAKLNDADFYDLFGPTKTSLKGYSLGLGYDKNLIFDTPRKLDLSVDGVFYGDLERLPDFQNVPVSFEELLTTKLHLTYSNVRSSLGHVDDEKGKKFGLLAVANYVNDDVIPGIVASFDYGFALPVGHSSIWLRSSAGGSFGELDDPFANFYFGGFGNNYVDHRGEKRYREYYAFPGAELNEIGGRTFVRSTLEWNLPPLRFRGVGKQGFYLNWARAALFAGGVVTNPENEGLRQTARNVGAQIDLRFTLLSTMDMTLSAGYAVAFGIGDGDEDEFMISLKIL